MYRPFIHRSFCSSNRAGFRWTRVISNWSTSCRVSSSVSSFSDPQPSNAT